MSEAADIRRTLRAARRALGAKACLQAGEFVCRRLQSLSQFAEARSIAIFLSSDGEVDTGPLVEACWAAGKSVWLPVVCAGRTLRFASYRRDTVLVPNRFGILEPDTSQADWIPAEDLDWVLTPLVAFDGHCNRMGMGGGYYDRTFAFLGEARARNQRPLLAGVAHELQRLGSLDAQPWDIPLDMVATPVAVYRRSTSQEPPQCSTG